MFDSLRYLYVRISGLNAKRTSEEGATATEYGLLVAFIAMVIVVGVTAFGGALNTFFNSLVTAVQGWAPGGGGGTP